MRPGLGFLAPAIAAVLALPLAASPRVPPPELVGLTLGMPDHEVRARLSGLGRLSESQPEAGGRKQIWQLRHRRFETLNLRLTAGLDLQWCTAYARPGRVRYADLGDTLAARRAGRFIWVWNVPAAGKRPGYQVTVRGTDPVYASSVALSPPLAPSEGDRSADAPADSFRGPR